MNPEQAVQAYEDLSAARFVAMHFGTFQLTDEPREEPEQRLRAEWARRGLDSSRCSVLPIGGSIVVRDDATSSVA